MNTAENLLRNVLRLLETRGDLQRFYDKITGLQAWDEDTTPTSAEPVAWKRVPAEATKKLLADASSKQAGGKQVLCYEGGSYYNAWLVFDEYEGGWIWMNEADSEPNPSHYMVLPAGPDLQSPRA